MAEINRQEAEKMSKTKTKRQLEEEIADLEKQISYKNVTIESLREQNGWMMDELDRMMDELDSLRKTSIPRCKPNPCDKCGEPSQMMLQVGPDPFGSLNLCGDCFIERIDKEEANRLAETKQEGGK